MLRKTCSIVFVIISVGAALSGCGGGSSDRAGTKPRPHATVTVTATSTAPATTGSELGQTSLPPTTSSDVRHVGQVISPSGNIRCALDVVVACVIQDETYEPLERPPCPVDWNDHYFGIGPKSGFRGICAGDTPLAGGPTVLPYGVTSTIGPHACLSEETGMTCWDTRTQHGFRIARTSYTIF
jgi:hypothetical protein